MNNKFYQKYKDLFYEDRGLPYIAKNKNFKCQHQHYSPILENSLKSKPNYYRQYQSPIKNQSILNIKDMSKESPINIEFNNRILPKLKQYDVEINQKIKGKNQNIFQNANQKIFSQEKKQFDKNFMDKKRNNPEDYQSIKKNNQQKSKKKVRFTQPQIATIEKKSFKQDYSSQYKNSYPPLSLSAVTQINKNPYPYSFELQQRKADKKFGKRIFRFKTQQQSPLVNKQVKHIQTPYKNQQIFPKKKLNFQFKQQVKLKTQPTTQILLKYSPEYIQQKNFEKNKQFSFKNEQKQEKKLKKMKRKQKLQEELMYQLERLQQKYKERKKSGKFRPIAVPNNQKKQLQQHKKFINQQQYQTEHGLSLLFSQYENQYEFVGKRLSDIKNFERFVSHLIINNYRQALLKRVQAKKKLEQRQKKLNKILLQESVQYYRSKSPFQE